MNTKWVWLLAICTFACASADRGGSSLRGALEALQRRQRSQPRGPILPQPDYDTMYEFVPPQSYPDYPVDVDEEEKPKTYLVKFLEDYPRPPEYFDYKLFKKRNAHAKAVNSAKKESAFRERTHHADNDRLRDLFMDKNEADDKKQHAEGPTSDDEDMEYALVLGELWKKYQLNKDRFNDPDPGTQGVVKLYKEKVVKKRYSDSDNWGPIAFKRKRSSGTDTDRPALPDYDRKPSALPGPVDPNFNAYDLADDDKDDLREEYAIAFQPLDDDNLSDLVDEDQLTYDTVEKRFPVTKRSSGPYYAPQKKRFVHNEENRETGKMFRSSAGTDPKIIKDLSKIFGDSSMQMIKNPVKRSSNHEEGSHEGKPPAVVMQTHNTTHGHTNSTVHEDESHEHHGHSMHHPGVSGKEIEHDHEHSDHESHQGESEKPINIKKKSIDWYDYFGIDKRTPKADPFVNKAMEDWLRKEYYDTFTKEVVRPLNSFLKKHNLQRNYVQAPPKDVKRSTTQDNESKLDNIDKKLKTMEGLIVDEALHYTNVGEELDSKEEQEMKEKLLSRLAAAYSLEKMRKALKEFKQSLQTQKAESNMAPSPVPGNDSKAKRVAVKKELLFINETPAFEKGDRHYDFEDEQGAGHYLNGKIDEQFSEGYMGGSGRHRVPVMSTATATGSCPVLEKIIQRCRGVDMLAGDRGQLFLPLCSLHQICYLCGEAPPTTCDLVFLSEADTTCEGDVGCQRAARSALMALRELHDNLADELDGECEASPCLSATLKLNIGWQRALLR